MQKWAEAFARIAGVTAKEANDAVNTKHGMKGASSSRAEKEGDVNTTHASRFSDVTNRTTENQKQQVSMPNFFFFFFFFFKSPCMIS